MKKILAYFFGGLACLSVGAGLYISVINRPVDSVPGLAGVGTNAVKTQNGLKTALDLLASRVPKKTEPLKAAVEEKNSTVLFMGDIMLGRDVAVRIQKNGMDYPFAKIKDTVLAASFAIANLEGPVTKENTAPENDMRFHFDPILASLLNATGFDAFSLANNHGLDQGRKGETDTEANLQASGLKYFGDVSSDNGPILRFETNGQKISVIGLHDVYRKIDPATVAKTIAAEKLSSDIVIVFPHWGDEYQHKQNARQTDLAHAFIDAGADLVIGSHPHVIEGAEVYKGKLIFYSLGNLIFDQYFSVDTQQGVALRLNIGAAGLVSVDFLPYEIPQSQPTFADGDKKAKLLQAIATWSAPVLKDQIVAGSIKLGE